MLDPLVFGDYPNSMKQIAGSRIPALTKAESELVKGSFDFIGIVYYFSLSVKDNSSVLVYEHRDYYMDQAFVNPGKEIIIIKDYFYKSFTITYKRMLKSFTSTPRSAFNFIMKIFPLAHFAFHFSVSAAGGFDMVGVEVINQKN